MKTIYPAIDIKNGKVVRLTQGDFTKETIYSNEPLEILRNYIQTGIEWVHIVNLDGALQGNFKDTVNYRKITEIIELCKKTNTGIQLGGGIRNLETISELISKGVNRVIIGTMAMESNDFIEEAIRAFGRKIAVGLDVLDGTIRIRAWKKNSDVEITDKFTELQDKGIKCFIITDISKDGMSEGLNLELYQNLYRIKKKETTLISSGGVSSMADIQDVLKFSDGVIVGKSLYNGNISKYSLESILDQIHQSGLIRRIIPCLDVKDGRVVKGIKFENLQDSGDPVELARYYCEEGADELVFLDISATIEGRQSMLKVIKEVAERVFIPFTVGGGIRTVEDMTNIIKAGAEKVSINSAAIKNPDLITEGAKKFGSQCIVVAIDVKKKGNSWEVYTHGGREPTNNDAVLWAIEAVKRGAGELLVTSMDKDGTKEGYDLDLLQQITKQVSVPVIASGGAGKYSHFEKALKCGAEAVLAASLFHQNIMSIRKLKHYLYDLGISIRI